MRRHVFAVLVLLTHNAAAVQVAATHPENSDIDIKDAIDAVVGENPDNERLQSLLTWAIEHSDPEELRRRASDPDLRAAHLQQQRENVREALDALQELPTEAQLLSQSLQIAGNTSNAEDMRQNALVVMQELVEQIDLANDFPDMGGLDVLNSSFASEGEVRHAALKVLATAASNNIKFQQRCLEAQPHLVPWLLETIAAGTLDPVSTAEQTAAALHALAALVRTLPVDESGLLTDNVISSAPRPWGSSTPPDTSRSITLPLEAALSFWGLGPGSGVGPRVKAQIVQCSVGLLTDLAVNNAPVQSEMLASRTVADLWQALCSRMTAEDTLLLERLFGLAEAVLVGNGKSANSAWGRGQGCARSLSEALEELPAEDYEDARMAVQRVQPLFDSVPMEHEEL